MMGDERDPLDAEKAGMIPRAIDNIFKGVGEMHGDS